MSLYFTTKKIRDAKPIAIDKETRKVVRLVDTQNPLEEDDSDYKIIKSPFAQYIPIPNMSRADRIYIAGPTGCGKSTQISMYLDEYKKIFPKKKIFLLSDAPQDRLLDQHKPIRIKLDEELVSSPIQTMELKDSICIFDDVDSISDKKIRNAVTSLYDSILKKGSSKDGIHLIITNHAISDFMRTRNILINSNWIVFFPRCSNNLGYTLQRQGLTKPQIEKLLKLPSRAVWLHTNYPMFYVSEHEIALL